jgi:hypothetical protein
MKLGDQVKTYNPTIELNGETGSFRVTTPGGENFYLRCELGEPPTIVGWGDPANGGGNNPNRVFLVTKMSERVTAPEHALPFRQTA